jgi:hypothetical protein
MNFTGKNLELVHEALILAVDDIHNEIATCPDAEIAELRDKQVRIKRLFDRVDRAMGT